MSFPVYSVRVERNDPPRYSRDMRRRARDPQSRAKSCVPRLRVPVFRVVLRKDRTIRVPETHVSMPAMAARVAHALIGDSPFEKMLAILIGGRSQILGAIIIATTSTVSSTAVSIRGVFVGAIAHNASAIVLAHNHPSGEARPSDEDVLFGRKANEASGILQIPILDHLIVTPDPEVWTTITC